MRQPSLSLPTRILRRHDHIIEEDFTELVIARNGPDRSDRDAGAIQIEQQKADPGMARLGLRVGTHQREHPIRIVCPSRPDFLPVHYKMIPLERGASGKAREIGAGAGL